MNKLPINPPEKKTLGEACDFKYGKSLPTANRTPGKHPVFGSNGQVGSHDQSLTQGPAIIIGRKGSFGEVHFSETPCWPIDTTYYIDERSTGENLKWLSYYLQTLGLKNLNRAAAIPGLNREDAYRINVRVPSLSEQASIANLLGSMDALREKRRRSIELLDELTQSIFIDMFGDPASNPKNWKKGTIDEIGEVITGNTPPRANSELYGDGIEWIKSDNIELDKAYPSSASERLSKDGERKARTVGSGALVFTCIAGSAKSIGNVALTDRRISFNQQINAVVPNSAMNAWFLLYHFRIRQDLVRNFSTSGMKRIVTKAKFKTIPVIIPPVGVQEEFSEKAQHILSLKKQHQAHLTHLDELFASVQQRAFDGTLWDDPAIAS